MMRVMEEQLEAAHSGAMPAELRNQLGRIPLVQDDDTGTLQHAIEIEVRRVIEGAAQSRKSGVEGVDRRIALLLAQVPQAPARQRLEYADLVSTRHQLACHSAQEVRIAVIPVGDQRVAEENESKAVRHAPPHCGQDAR